MSADRFATHSPAVLLGLILAGPVAVAVCAVFLCSSWAQRGGPPKTADARWRDLAVLCGAGSVACYTWGVIQLVFTTGDSAFNACMEVVGRDRMTAVDGYEGQYIPLRLVCSMSDGTSYTAGVPGYVNPVVAVLALAAVMSAGLALGNRQTKTAGWPIHLRRKK
ncbi:hypothetical protein GCM10009716_02220 [Streptomyces sodiiphilus]|uniref:Integral membrane protein n=1 Tax=Streptomyces sodiiphilus TaxID=226217 RepID=A0ABN2NQK6_9ACTN